MLDPEGQLIVLGRAGSKEVLSRGEVVEARSGVVGVEVLDEDRDQQPRLAEAALGELSEQFAHGMPLTIQVEVELADPGPAGQDGIHLGVGGCPAQPGVADQELPARGFQRRPLSTRAPITLHRVPSRCCHPPVPVPVRGPAPPRPADSIIGGLGSAGRSVLTKGIILAGTL